jgi:hypothetical protein
MCSTAPSRRSRRSRHDPEDWPCEGPPWLWPTDEEPDEPVPDEDELEEEEPVSDDEPEPEDESSPVDDEEPVDSESVDDEPLDDEPLVVEPDDDVPVDAVECEPVKSTTDVMPAAARLVSPTIEVTTLAVRLPAERASMSSTSGVERCPCDDSTLRHRRPSTLSVTHHLSKTRWVRASR